MDPRGPTPRDEEGGSRQAVGTVVDRGMEKVVGYGAVPMEFREVRDGKHVLVREQNGVCEEVVDVIGGDDLLKRLVHRFKDPV